MITILILDDNQRKIKDLRSLIENSTVDVKIETATNIISGKRYVSTQHFDLLILDLALPLRDGNDPLPLNGLNFLSDMKRGSGNIIRPVHIIGFSAYDEFIESFKERFEDDLWSLVKYDESSDSWNKKILSKIEYLIQSKTDLQNNSHGSYIYDLAIITALRNPELDAVLNLDANWQSFKLANDSTEYFKGVFALDGKKINVVAAAAPQMGMVATSVLTNKLIYNFRPKFVAMTGIAGGVKGVGNFGDILISDISFDSGSGKVKTNEDGNAIFLPDFKSINLDADLKENFLSCKGSRTFLNKIKSDWKNFKIDTELNIHIGPLATGAGVIENKKIIEEIKGHSRKLIGIDMETYGVFYTSENCSKPKPIAAMSIKSISDFGDPDKNDNYQTYAAFTSANFLYHFTLSMIDF